MNDRDRAYSSQYQYLISTLYDLSSVFLSPVVLFLFWPFAFGRDLLCRELYIKPAYPYGFVYRLPYSNCVHATARPQPLAFISELAP